MYTRNKLLNLLKYFKYGIKYKVVTCHINHLRISIFIVHPVLQVTIVFFTFTVQFQ